MKNQTVRNIFEVFTMFIVLGAVAMAMMLSVGCARPVPEKGEQGIAGANGVDGHDGLNGRDGRDGVDGHDGATGPQGPQGADGQIATVVKLCPGAPSYGHFIEVALCINNKLFGVYSANGGFMTELPPGNYSSSGIGSACNLTVLPNCVVQPL